LPDDDYLPTWYALRTDPAYAAEAAQLWPDPTIRAAETDAATKAAAHANTPAIAYFDTLGRTFLTIADNAAAGKYPTRVALDIEGNQRSVTDALGRAVMTYDYNMLGTKIHQNSVDAGERWMLNNVTGKPLMGWDSRNHQLRHEYDPLRRPTNLFVQSGSSPEQLAERIVYGEGQANDQALNLRAKVFQQYDGAGIVTNNKYDFKGNLLSGTRQLLQGYKDQVDWSKSPARESETFTSSTVYDALNRATQLVLPKSDHANARFNIIQPIYNEANLLERVDAWLERSAAPQGSLDPSTTNFHPVTNIDYNAKAQRELIVYGNGAETAYSYDPNTFRLLTLTTTRASDNATLQALSYTYDPVGNIEVDP